MRPLAPGVNTLTGSSVAAKRQVSGILVTIGALLVPLAFVIPTKPNAWWALAGAVTMLLAYLVNRVAADQEGSEAAAADYIEWKREEQRFRRTVQKVWEMLKEQHGNERFKELVDHAGTPESPGESAAELEACLSLWMPYLGFDPRPILGRPITPDEQKRRQLRADFEAAKDILEVWSVAMGVGGGRERALRRIIADLGTRHRPSMRLMWWLARAHAEYKRTADPDFRFVTDIWDTMLSEGGHEGQQESTGAARAALGERPSHR